MLKFFGLAENPFSVSPSPRFFYLSPNHKAILAKVQYVLEYKQGMTAIFGDVGTGKTSLARTILDILADNYEVIYIYNPNFKSDTHMLRTICSEFEVPMKRSHQAQLEAFQGFLFNLHMESKTAVIIADECQLMRPKLLEFFRQLSNLETNESKLVQCILCGQTELKVKLKKKRALWSRIIMASSLDAFSLEDTVEMIAYRLVDVAKGDPEMFTSDALERIYFHSQGIPREVVKLCAQSMKIAHINQIKPIDGEIVDLAFEGAEK
jgi:general secretion pathway protein A